MSVAKKKRKPCPSCSASFQKGHMVTRLVLGGAQRQRVCQACYGLAVAVLASDAPAICTLCNKNLATMCLGCLDGALKREGQANLLTAVLRTNGRTFKKAKVRS